MPQGLFQEGAFPGGGFSGIYLGPVAVDDEERGIVSGLPLFQFLNSLPELILTGLPLLQPLC